MSDSLDEIVYSRRAHRCQPPAGGRLGREYRCDCGTVYQYRQTNFGRQWLPVSDVVASGAHSKRSSSQRGTPGIRT